MCGTWRRPRRVLNGPAFIPAVDFPFEHDLIAVLYTDTDRPGFNLGVAFEGGFDLALYVRSVDVGLLDRDLVCYAADSGQLADVVFGCGLAIVPFNAAG